MKCCGLLITIVSIGVISSCSTAKSVSEPVNTPEETTKKDNIVELKAKIDDLNNRISVMNEQIESLKARVKDENGKSAEERIISAYKKEKPQENITKEDEPKDNSIYSEYSDAFALFKNKEYSKAMIAFSSFIDKYPDTILTDHAYFWLGESYYQQREYTLAISEYLKVIKKFSNGSKTPEAMLRVAMSYTQLGEKKDSDAYLNGLASKYPNSKAAAMAIRVGSK